MVYITYKDVSSSSAAAFLVISLGFTIFGEIFAYVTVLDLTIGS